MALPDTLIGAATGLTRLNEALNRVTRSASAAATVLGQPGPGSQNELEAEIQWRQVLRVGAARGLVGVQNVTEAEIQRRQFTRVGAQRGLVGVQNTTEAEIMRRIFSRAGLVGIQNPTEAEIFRRMVTVRIRRA
jgi:hypothetical protein